MSFYDTVTLLVNILLVVIFVVIVWWFVSQYRIMSLRNRLGKYAIDSVNINQSSVFDHLIEFYLTVQKKLNKFLYRSGFLKDYAKKYEKYIDKTKSKNSDPMNYISAKVFCGFFIVLLFIISSTFQHDNMAFLNITIGFLVGFFIPDLFLKSKDYIIKKNLEDGLLKAITIMNNSFKSGRSIIQTLKIVSDEIDGPLKSEFLKMHIDLSYGLGIDTVFERFSKRVKLPEVQYISTSLIILNNTGGDIVKVFSSIEKTFFNNRKLKDELNNLTAAAKFLYRVLEFIPILFALIIYFLDPTYFLPLINTNLGIMILIIIIILYISYIFIVKKIINIKEK